MKSGFVAIVGRPNVGKSSILNNIVGRKISIVSNKSQTTRDNIQGIYNDDESQIIFIDTPGIHKPHNDLGSYLDKKAYQTIRDCDLSILVVDASKEFGEGDQYLFDHLKFDTPLIIVLNKIDLTNIELITNLKDKYSSNYVNSTIIETSCNDNFNLDLLVKKIKEILPEGPKYFDVNYLTDKDFMFQVQEIVREKCLKLLKKEVPHGIAVICNNVENKSKDININCKIICEKESQKGIIIGQKGQMIKKIGTYTRQDLEKMTSKHVNIELFVTVEEDWRNSNKILQELGYK